MFIGPEIDRDNGSVQGILSSVFLSQERESVSLALNQLSSASLGLNNKCFPNF